VVAALIVLWMLIEIIINPIGDFPLDDDWTYALPVQWLVERGRLGLTQQNAAFFTQLLWGSLWTAAAGFSYTVLRLSTLATAALALVVTYLAGREVGLSRPLAAIAVGLLLINPVFVSLANTFMTDVPFLALMMVSVLLLLRALKYDSAAYLWVGLATLLGLVLLRQVGIAIAFGLIVALAIKEGMSRGWLLRTIVPTAVMLGVVFAYRRWLEANNLLPAMYDMYTGGLKALVTDLAHLRLGAGKPVVRGIGFGLMHLGLWMFPLIILMLPRWSGATTRRGERLTFAALALITTSLTAALWYSGMLMPLGMGGNILVDLGTGIRSLDGPAPHAPHWCWVAITWASAFGATALVLALGQVARRILAQLRSGQPRQSLWLPSFLLVSLVFIYAPFSALYGPWFDRYLLPVMVLSTLLLTGETIGPTAPLRPILDAHVVVSAALALIYLGFAVASTHDYLAWNRQRWAAGSLLIERGITPADIRGGYEFDQYYDWCDLPAHMSNARRSAFASRPEQLRDHARYVIAFGDLDGFNRIRRLPVDRWLPLSPDQIVILEKSGDAGSATGADPTPR
jgi:hypothetical protein